MTLYKSCEISSVLTQAQPTVVICPTNMQREAQSDTEMNGQTDRQYGLKEIDRHDRYRQINRDTLFCCSTLM